jgi:imidazolonepropionase-like amidohydrolase
MRYTLVFLLMFFTCELIAQTDVTVHNINIVDVINLKIHPGRTVEVRDGKIHSIRPTKGNSPRGTLPANEINGTGKFLMPGLVDAHVHFFQSGGLYTRPDAIDLRKYFPYDKEISWTHQNMDDLLRRYVATGITTVIDVGSTYSFLKQRDTFQSKTFAPKIFMTGPLLTTWEPSVYKGLQDHEPFHEMASAEDARKFVRQQLPYNPDFIKIWYIVRDRDTKAGAMKTLDWVRAAIDEAHKNNLKVAVHATQKITAQLAVENGADYLVHGIDDEVVDDQFLKLLKQKKTVVCPTMIVGGHYREVFAQEYRGTEEDHRVSNPFPLGSLFHLRHIKDTGLIRRYRTYGQNSRASQAAEDSILRANLVKMVNAGIPIATGTDAGNIGTLHASSYYEELQAMKSAGLSNWQILQSSTINGARVLGKETDFGSIEVGKSADLIILEKNPTDDIMNVKSIAHVINKGAIIKIDSLVRSTPEKLVEQQLNAYNDHNLEAFLVPYAEDVDIYTFPDKLQFKGKAEMRKRYQFLNNTPDLHCELQNRIVQGNTVIDHERVTSGGRVFYAVAIYQIVNGKIKTVHFTR